MPTTRTTPSFLTAASPARFQIVNALIWAATIVGAAVVVKATDEFIYLLVVLVAGSACSWTSIWRLMEHGGSPAARGPG
ncbi:hypothetical protein [Jannaschia sp. R86511]|uniref:hypothetical protein n=1 Tax=Jannaschia sp. R86511 TaxID=3093853 RepID=UPI0036D375FB